MNEIWKDIEGAEEYQVSNHGNVRKKNHDKRSPQYRYLRANKNNNGGYLRISLTCNGKSRMVLVHRLVAMAFIENPDGKPVVNHKDGNKTNNHVSNLEWCTVQENTMHAFKNGLCDQMISKYSKAINQFSLDGHFIKKWKSLHEIQREKGFKASMICRVMRHKKNKAYGYLWRYAIE